MQLSSRSEQLCDLGWLQLPILARWNIQLQRPVADALDLFHVVPNLLEHAADLAIPAFDQRDFEPRIGSIFNDFDLGRRRSDPSFPIAARN
jgi:hypothetical protein